MDEKLRILKMIEDRTITAEQVAALMSTINIELSTPQTAIMKNSYDKKCFA